MRRRLIVLAGIVLLAASCGDDDDSDAGGSTTPPASEAPSESGAPTSPGSEAPSGSAPVSLQGQVNNEGTAEIGDEVELELDDYYFGPTFMKATPGATVTLELENEGDDTHTFTIDALDVDQEVAAGDTAEVEVTLPEEGTVMFYCRFHRDRGMQGAFFFDEGATATTGG
jgi:plastocyanin